MSSSETFYWHDYETFGANPSYDRPVQFAGQRTDLELNPIGEPLVIYAAPPLDYLPQPGACLVTGITPQHALAHGLPEAEFIAQIHAQLAQPGTCGVGYNSLRFDDTVTRFTLYRNLRDAYAREYGDGRSRWDLIDPLRTAYALRPDGIEWPLREDGLPSFRLEDLVAANNLAVGKAHDALVDVQATIAMAKLLRSRQPKLYAWLYRHRHKQAVAALIDIDSRKALLHVSGMFGARRANLGLVLPLLWHPKNGNELICADLSVDPTLLFDLDTTEIRARLYRRSSEADAGELRPGLKSVHINRCPVLLPAKMADDAVAERAQLDRAGAEVNLALLCKYLDTHEAVLRDKLRAVFAEEGGVGGGSSPGVGGSQPSDPDQMLYSGGFLSRDDRATLDRLISLAPDELAQATAAFDDSRLPEMLFRYRARNYPDTLSADERERWEEFRFSRLSEGDGIGLDLENFHRELERALEQAGSDSRSQAILIALQEWGDSLLAV